LDVEADEADETADGVAPPAGDDDDVDGAPSPGEVDVDTAPLAGEDDGDDVAPPAEEDADGEVALPAGGGTSDELDGMELDGVTAVEGAEELGTPIYATVSKFCSGHQVTNLWVKMSLK
jgi:hypothetical protein